MTHNHDRTHTTAGQASHAATQQDRLLTPAVLTAELELVDMLASLIIDATDLHAARSPQTHPEHI